MGIVSNKITLLNFYCFRVEVERLNIHFPRLKVFLFGGVQQRQVAIFDKWGPYPRELPFVDIGIGGASA